MSSVKLSAIAPIYNVEEYLPRAIESILNQTYKNLEIILVDDGSTDHCGLICDEYAKKDSRIIVIHKENGGIASAIKAGAQAATGEYTIVFGPDDWLERNAYEMVAADIEKYHPDIVSFGWMKDYGEFLEEYPNIIPEGLYTREEFWNVFNRIVQENHFFSQPIDMSQVDKAFKTELFQKHENNCSEQLKKNVDDAMVLPALMDMGNIYIDSRYWYHYCVRKTSILWQTAGGDCERAVVLAKHLINVYRNYDGNALHLGKFLLYKIIHHMMLDTPEMFIDENKCWMYPKLKKDSSIVVYGKGVFGNRLIGQLKRLNFTQIIDNIDSNDVSRLDHISGYDYIVVAVFNARIVNSILKVLEEKHIQRDKILIIEKNNIKSEMLPEEVRKLYEQVVSIKGI